MPTFKVPSGPKIQLASLNNFLGVDFNEYISDNRRSPKLHNLINSKGYLESRNGIDIVGDKIGTNINGVWNIDANEDIFIVHSGDKLYEVNKTFDHQVLLHSELADVKSKGIYLGSKLLILDGKRAILYGKYGNNWEAKYVDEVGYIPTTSIARSPDGLKNTTYESMNNMNYARINSFLGNDTDTIYVLDHRPISDENVIVKQLNDQGEWIIIDDTAYLINIEKGQIEFSNPLGNSPVDGRDNVQIQFSIEDVLSKNLINKCTIATTFGYQGNNNRIFVSGNEDFANVDWYCEANDPTYWPDDNFATIGTAPIINYNKVNDGTIAIQKKVSDTDYTIYYRSTNMINGVEIFPLSEGVRNIGCLNSTATSNFKNDPLFLSEQGICAILSDNDEKFAANRSFYIDTKLLAESNLEEAVGITFNEKYYLAINNKVYVADSRYKSENTISATDSYQYEWYYLTDIPVRVWFIWNNKLYFGTNEGYIMTFTNDYEDFIEFDENNNKLYKPVESYWESTYLDLGSTVVSKTVKRLTLIHNPLGKDTNIELGFILPDGTVQTVSVEYTELEDIFPKTIQEKEKIKKLMFVKFYIKSVGKSRISFSDLNIEYIFSGRYRGD